MEPPAEEINWDYVEEDKVDLLNRDFSIQGLGVMAFTIGASLLFTWLATGKRLRPLEKLTDTMNTIDQGRLDERLPIPNGTSEVQRLTESFMISACRFPVRRCLFWEAVRCFIGRSTMWWIPLGLRKSGNRFGFSHHEKSFGGISGRGGHTKQCRHRHQGVFKIYIEVETALCLGLCFKEKRAGLKTVW